MYACSPEFIAPFLIAWDPDRICRFLVLSFGRGYFVSCESKPCFAGASFGDLKCFFRVWFRVSSGIPKIFVRVPAIAMLMSCPRSEKSSAFMISPPFLIAFWWVFTERSSRAIRTSD